MRRTLPIVLLAFAFATMPAQAEDGAKVDWKKNGKWSNLATYIGTYDYDSVMGDKAVKAQLDKMLKGQKIDLKSAFEVSAPIGFENDCLILKGNPEHKGDTNRAYMEVCINQGNVNLAAYDTGKITVFSQFGEYQFLTEGMRSWIYFQNHSEVDLQSKPDNLQFVVQAK